MEGDKRRVFQLKETLINDYGVYLHRNEESLGRQACVLAPHLPTTLSGIYSSLGGQLSPNTP
ncbi:hypothetical protein RND71_009945 [Anisodus tanguticus]|uniref:Uncharacterized protein n=1 Tax=Anisodus tanguticus TaxID=243964 RepID=A0AAE1SIA5_9SOLA|nr:hypothetical protein RND71_009945 [Anisodus tanguticus]